MTLDRALSIRSLMFLLMLGSATGLLGACAQSGRDTPANADPSLQDTGCKPGQAQLAVHDNSLQILCGCAEPAGQFFTVYASPALTCTVAPGTTVFFHYVATMLNHQIVPTGTPAFVPSPLSNPKVDFHYRTAVHGVTLDEVGVYLFQDAYNDGLQGRVVVQ